jgi:hypothetical protein
MEIEVVLFITQINKNYDSKGAGTIIERYIVKLKYGRESIGDIDVCIWRAWAGAGLCLYE